MVVLHFKRSDKSLFLFQTTVNSLISDVIDSAISIHNERLRLLRLISSCEDLINYGPIKPYMEQGLTEEQIAGHAQNKTPEKIRMTKNGREILFNPDPTGRRTGEGNIYVAAMMTTELEHANAILSPNRVALNEFLTLQDIDQAFLNIKGAIMIAYPMGLPSDDPVQIILDNNEDLTVCSNAKEIFTLDNVSLWWASKELVPNKHLSDFIGKNEKSKVIVKLQRKGQGAPVREPAIDEKTQREMTAFFYKKQEEHKKLADNDEDDYLNSSWANPKALKNHFQGISNVSWRFK
ncbi:hypothetical protein ROZALSC1DRAFT_27041 [Rozella allomycis CSF55]|uniref:Uncharacterized protein n=1 Tax=Rozella allomycis (strain CSF55) TaxID=988480 RepID=A0A075AWN9_ROZAC|nr:Protein of unknown function DUF2870 domain-containing protein [Rozella allomycis CSF55]RKP21553.1 hypothetical protein ROZALSC1DRAFT_27041 [Rozella allomycis CSF55]|eukprot:EPZ34652.1 Protein of unknown function DUF2870 domain-containing protein [Rozella allomycis CSF55]